MVEWLDWSEDIFLLFRNVFSKDQYAFKLSWNLVSLVEILCLETLKWIQFFLKKS